MDKIEKSLLFYNTFSISRYFKALERTSWLSSMLLQCVSRQLQQPFRTVYLAAAQSQTFQIGERKKLCWKDSENECKGFHCRKTSKLTKPSNNYVGGIACFKTFSSYIKDVKDYMIARCFVLKIFFLSNNLCSLNWVPIKLSKSSKI